MSRFRWSTLTGLADVHARPGNSAETYERVTESERIEHIDDPTDVSAVVDSFD